MLRGTFARCPSRRRFLPAAEDGAIVRTIVFFALAIIDGPTPGLSANLPLADYGRVARHPPGIGFLLIACYRSGGFLAATLASNGGPDECHGVGSAQVTYAAALCLP